MSEDQTVPFAWYRDEADKARYWLGECDRLQAKVDLADDLLRRLSEWDMLNPGDGGAVVADAPYWKREIAKVRAYLALAERSET